MKTSLDTRAQEELNKKLRFKKKNLSKMKCQTCMSNFNHDKRRPFVLIPCTHTICVKCSAKLNEHVCPVCNETIIDRNPNWAIIDMIPNSDADRLKLLTQSALNETQDLKNKLNDLQRQHHQENLANLKRARKEINSFSNRFMKLIAENQNKLIDEIKSIEANLEVERINQIKNDRHIDAKISEIRKRMSKNELKDNQIESLMQSFNKKNTDLQAKIEEKNKRRTFYEFVPAVPIKTSERLVGKIVLKQTQFPKLNENSYRLKAKHLLDEEKYDEAIAALKEAIQLNPSCSECYHLKGLAYYGLKDFKQAIKYYDKSIELDSNQLEVFINKGNALKELKDYRGAIKCWFKALCEGNVSIKRN